MSRLNNYETAIIHFLGCRGDSNINEVANGVHISWITARIYLENLKEKGYVVKIRIGKNNFIWSLRKFAQEGGTVIK